MGKALEEHLAEFVLGMQRGPGWRSYVKSCLEFWAQHYGTKTAENVRSIINARMKDDRK